MISDVLTIRELARRAIALDGNAFVKQFPDPVLVLEPRALADSGPRVTADGWDKTNKVSSVLPRSLSETDEGDVPSPDALARTGDLVVVFLKKSPRNPFGNVITVGRAPNNDIVLPSSSLSKVHAIFTKLGATWSVTDQNSTNGTLVDGKKVSQGSAVSLPDSASLQFGPNLRARFMTAKGLADFVASYQRTSA